MKQFYIFCLPNVIGFVGSLFQWCSVDYFFSLQKDLFLSLQSIANRKHCALFIGKSWPSVQLLISYCLLCLDQTSVRFLSFLPLNSACLQNLAHAKKSEICPLINFSWEPADHSRTLSCQTQFRVASSPKVLLISACPSFTLYKKQHLSVWFWTACQFLRSECSPYCSRSFFLI